MAEQLEMFKVKEGWKEQKQRWWSMHDFRPVPGMLVMIDECPWNSLEADVLEVDEENETIKVQIRKYPDCPWIRTEVLDLNYYKVDPLLRESKTEPVMLKTCG